MAIVDNSYDGVARVSMKFVVLTETEALLESEMILPWISVQPEFIENFPKLCETRTPLEQTSIAGRYDAIGRKLFSLHPGMLT